VTDNSNPIYTDDIFVTIEMTLIAPIIVPPIIVPPII